MGNALARHGAKLQQPLPDGNLP
ncbi:MAG: hypothetical protein RJB62_1376, partial [Pseudomonadota bacterium]